jgi:hypothetical protein
MKRLFLLFSAFIVAQCLCFAQLNVQSQRWALQGKQIDFTQYPPQHAPLSTGSVSSGINSFSQPNGDMMFQLVDNEIKSPTGNVLSTFANDFGLGFGQEIAVTEKPNTCNEFLIFYLSRYYKNMVTHEDLKYSEFQQDPVTGQINMTQQDVELYKNNTGGDKFGGIALSKEKSDGTRYLYYAGMKDYNSGTILKITIDGSGNVSAPTEVFGGFYDGGLEDNFYVAELEISHDGNKLAFSRINFGYPALEHQDVVIFDRNPSTGNISNPTIIELESNDHYANYPGIEFGENNDYLYVIGEQEDNLYRIDLATLNINEFSIPPEYSNSMLELGRNGKLFVAASDNLAMMDNNGNIITPVFMPNTTMAKNDHLQSAYGVTMYLLPDQIDGQDYSQVLLGETECCYMYTETPANDNMPGVQIQTSGTERDIIIQSGNSVTWTATSNSFGNVAEAYMEPGDIIIEPGASLTIEDMIIHFREGYEVQMDNNSAGNVGSRLVLDNTTLTVFDECEGDKLWAGVDLDGGWGSLPQTPYSTSPQPYLEMQNGSTIEFAEKGIDAPAGGLIRASDSYFENNITNVDITGFEDQNSLLENSVFVWDDALYNKGYTPANSLHLWNASGVNVKGCNFVNNANSSIGIDDRGVGVLADITDFSVKGSCADILCLQYNRNSFENLKYGIKSNGGDNVLIDRSDFIENRGGAWIISSEALQFTRNDLNVYDYDVNSSLDYETFGLYLEGCTGYQVEENDFHDGLLGLVVYNSGYDPNEIYYNDFYNLNGNDVATGAIGMGANGWIMDQPNGLQFRCNDFNQTDYAIGVTGGDLHTQNGLITVDLSTISWKQGQNFQTGDYESADNTFWLFWLTGEHDFYIDENVSGINLYGEKYRYNGAYDNLANRDANINNFNSNEVGRHYYGTFTTREEECPSNLGGGGWIPTPLLLDDLNQKNDSLSDIEQEYNALLSIQNENSLQLSAQNANEFTTHNVHNALMEASPYLTASVLNAYMMNNQVSEMSRTSVLLANSPLPVSVQENLNNADLSSNLKQYIRQQQDGENPLERMENQISTFKSSIQYITDRLHIRYMNSDSVELISEWQQMLESKSDFHSKEKLVSLYKSAGNLEAAENLLANMETELIGSDKPEKLKQIRVKQVELRLRNNDVSESLNASDKKFLYSVAEDYNNRSGSMARGLLMSAGLETYEPVIFMPNPTNAKSASAGMISEQEDLSRDEDIELSTRFNIYPNPATDILSVEFITSEEACTFVIYDIQGRQIRSIEKEESLGYLTIDVSDLESGSYIIYSPQLGDRKQFVVKH